MTVMVCDLLQAVNMQDHCMDSFSDLPAQLQHKAVNAVYGIDTNAHCKAPGESEAADASAIYEPSASHAPPSTGVRHTLFAPCQLLAKSANEA